jgi:hypothetical protein
LAEEEKAFEMAKSVKNACLHLRRGVALPRHRVIDWSA